MSNIGTVIKRRKNRFDQDSSLTNKMELFCREFVIDYNATNAAIKAGYSVHSATSKGCDLLKDKAVIKKVKELQQEMQKNLGITAENVVAELAKVGFSNIQDFIKPGNSIEDISKMSREKAAAISSVEINQVTVGRKKVTTVKFKLHNKVEGLEKLGRHLGIFEKDNKQKTDLTISEKTEIRFKKRASE